MENGVPDDLRLHQVPVVPFAGANIVRPFSHDARSFLPSLCHPSSNNNVVGRPTTPKRLKYNNRCSTSTPTEAEASDPGREVPKGPPLRESRTKLPPVARPRLSGGISVHRGP